MQLEKQLDSIVQFVSEWLSRFSCTRVIQNVVYPNEKRNILHYLVEYRNARSIDEQNNVFKRLKSYISLLCEMPESKIFHNYFLGYWESLEVGIPFIRCDEDYLEIKNQLLPRAAQELTILTPEFFPLLSPEFRRKILTLNEQKESLEEIFYDFAEDEPDNKEKYGEIKKLLTTLKNDFLQLIINIKKIKSEIILDNFLRDIEKSKKMIELREFSEREKIIQKQTAEIQLLKYHEENRKKVQTTKFIDRAKILRAQKNEHQLIAYYFAHSQKIFMVSDSSSKIDAYDRQEETHLLDAAALCNQRDSWVCFFRQEKRVLYSNRFLNDGVKSKNFAAKIH